MAFHPIDLETWERREFYLHYMDEVVCSYSMTVELDVSGLRGEKLYPAMLWLLTDTVNQYEAFRTHLSDGRLGVFDTMNPSYTIFHPDSQSFSAIWTEFCPDYPEFLERYLADAETYRSAKAFSPKPGQPENCFDVSMIPWVSFSSFHLDIHGPGRWLLPIFTMGKVSERGGKRLLPLAIQVHHAVCDGYHAARFVDTLQEKIARFPSAGQQTCL